MGEPAARNARGGPTNEQVGRESEYEHDDRRFNRVEDAERHDLVGHVHGERQKNDSSGRVEPFAQPQTAFFATRED
jgi:hypothetical protein